MIEDKNEPLWTSTEAAAATAGSARGDWAATGVAIDSRTLAPGDLFVALKDVRDGHDFVAAARANGAVAALVSREVDDGPALVVTDTLEAVRRLAVASRERSAAVRVAVTGSVGKTSVKEALLAVFRRAGRAHASEKSYNNHWGAPLSLARMPRTTERAVFEIGMNHPGEIRPLSEIIRPHVAIVTKIAPAHLEGMGTLEAIADEKAEIFRGLASDGAAIIPGDDPFADRLAHRASAAGAGRIVRFGTDPAHEAQLVDLESDADGGARGVAEIFGQRAAFRLPMSGTHWGLNAVAVLAAASLARTPLDVAISALAETGAPAGRGAALTVRLPDGEATVLDDSYNANPASMEAAIKALGVRTPGPGGRRLAALGEMRELGPRSGELHAALANLLEVARVDAVYLVGEGMLALADALPEERVRLWAETSGDVSDKIRAEIRSGDVVLVKGSNAANMAHVVETLKGLDASLP